MKAAAALIAGTLLAAAPAAARAADCGDPGSAACAPWVTMTASAPVSDAGQAVTLTATSPGLDPTYAWDLDGDGAYDDAAGASVTRAFAPGATVGVRVTTADGRTATETRALAVRGRPHPIPELKVGVAAPHVGQSFDVTADGIDDESAIAKVELDLDGDGAYDVWSSGPSPLTHATSFADPGTHMVRARVTDAAGASAVATFQLQVGVEGQRPDVFLTVNGSNGGQDGVVRAGTSIGLFAAANDPDGPIADYAFDLDGDGTYETDAGANPQLTTSLAAGEREIGVKVTDADGLTATSRRSVSVFAGTTGGYPTVYFTYRGHATTGVPFDLSAKGYGYLGTLSYAWDADGDGDFDDGTATGDGGVGQEVHLQHTYTSPGTYQAQVRVRTPDGATATVMQTIEVRGPATPGFTWIQPYHFGSDPTNDFSLFVVTTSGSVLSFDTDGDGEFDDTPAHPDAGYRLSVTQPTTVAIKATSGTQSVIATVQLAPDSGFDGVFPRILAGSGGAQSPFQPGARVTLGRVFDGSAFCCNEVTDWDLAGDGNYRYAPGAPTVSFTAGVHTIGLRHEADWQTWVRDTFPVGPAPARLSVRLRTPRLRSMLAHGLTVKTGCSCRATAGLKLAAKTLGKATGRRTVHVKLTAKGRRALRGLKRAELKLTVSAPGVKTVTKHLTVKR